MNFGNNKIFFLLFAYICTVSLSCSPLLRSIAIETREPAAFVIDSIENKSIALYISVDGIGVERMLDSLLAVNFASGMANRIEEELGLSEGGVYVFCHYPPKDTSLNMEYIQSLSRQAESDMIILIDSMSVSGFSVIGSEPMHGDYRLTTSKALLNNEINVYDGITSDLIYDINYRDTVFWESISSIDYSNLSAIQKSQAISGSVIFNFGREIASLFFDKWTTEYRDLYVSPIATWDRAFRYAEEFEWEKAIEIWESELSHKNKYRVACAAINIALGCEMTGKPELALEWLKIAERSYYNPKRLGLDEFKRRLEREIEKKKAGL